MEFVKKTKTILPKQRSFRSIFQQYIVKRFTENSFVIETNYNYFFAICPKNHLDFTIQSLLKLISSRNCVLFAIRAIKRLDSRQLNRKLAQCCIRGECLMKQMGTYYKTCILKQLAVEDVSGGLPTLRLHIHFLL